MIVHEEERRRVWQAHEARSARSRTTRGDCNASRSNNWHRKGASCRRRSAISVFGPTLTTTLKRMATPRRPQTGGLRPLHLLTSSRLPTPRHRRPPRLGLSVSSRTAPQASATAAAHQSRMERWRHLQAHRPQRQRPRRLEIRLPPMQRQRSRRHQRRAASTHQAPPFRKGDQIPGRLIDAFCDCGVVRTAAPKLEPLRAVPCSSLPRFLSRAFIAKTQLAGAQ